MRVNEYLAFRASLKGVPGRRIKERLADVSDLCGLAEVERKMISTLSKGFRQRVGLADAMIHEPDLLILDEPTIGLDPNQIRQVRELIKNLRRHHTILLSTHILSEVEMTCSRVIIINKGRIEALDTPENLRSRIGSQGEVTVEARTEDPQALAKMRAVRGVKEVIQKKMGEWTRFTLQVENDPRESLHALAVQEGWPVRELTRRSATLEQVFAEVTNADEQE
jgi:ABC-2 type transport system ATP-binding protein